MALTSEQQDAINTISGNQLVSGLVSGLFGLGSSLLSSNTAANAANRSADTQLGMFNTINDQQAPYRTAGYSALGSALGGAGLAPPSGAVASGQFTRAFGPSDLNSYLSPNYQFMLDQGIGATRNQMNRVSGMNSGNTLKAINDYAQNFAGNAYQNAFNNYNANQTNIYNRLMNVAGLGQTANAAIAEQGPDIAASAGAAIRNAGAAQAGGIMGASNALTGGITNAMGWYSLPSILNLTNFG